MKQWTNLSALLELELLVEEIDGLHFSHPFSEEHKAWLYKAYNLLRGVFGYSSSLFLNFYNIPWCFFSTEMISASGPGFINEGQVAFDTTKMKRSLQFAKDLLLIAKDELHKYDVEDLFEDRIYSKEDGIIVKLINLCEHKLVKMLKDKKIRDDSIFNIFNELLSANGLSYKKECTPFCKGNCDYSFFQHSLILKIRILYGDENIPGLIKDINDDFQIYRQSYSNILYFVFDTGKIKKHDKTFDCFTDETDFLFRILKI